MGVRKEKWKTVDCENGEMVFNYEVETRFPIYNSTLDVPRKYDTLIQVGSGLLIFIPVLLVPVFPLAILYPSGEAPLIPFLFFFFIGLAFGALLGIILITVMHWILTGWVMFDFVPLPER